MADAAPPDAAPRVWIVAPGDLFGGAERQILTLCMERGTRFHVRLLPIFDGPLAARARAHGLDVAPLTGTDPTFADSVRRLRAQLRTGMPDVLHLHGYRASVTAACALWGLARQPAVVKTVHGAQEMSGVGFAMRMRMRLYAALEKLADRRLRSTMIYVSEDLRRRIAGSVDGALVIHNGAAAAVAAGERPAAFASDALNLVAIGRVDRVKNLGVAVAALATPALRGRARLHVVGDGPLAGQLSAQARAAGLDDAVRFHGFVENPQPYLAHADLLLLPSLHEGIPYVVLEAMQAGTCVIAANVGGIPEVLSHGETAWLVDPRDSDALAEAIRGLADAPERRRALAEQARERFRRCFAAPAMVEAYSKLFLQLTRKPKPL